METGKTYKLTYGNGTQVFHVTRISPKGKAFGLRLFESRGTWVPSPLKVGDRRVIGECDIPQNAPPLPDIDAMVAKLQVFEEEFKVASEKYERHCFEVLETRRTTEKDIPFDHDLCSWYKQVKERVLDARRWKEIK